MLVGGDLGVTGSLKWYMIEVIPPDGFDTSLFGLNFSNAEIKWALYFISYVIEENDP